AVRPVRESLTPNRTFVNTIAPQRSAARPVFSSPIRSDVARHSAPILPSGAPVTRRNTIPTFNAGGAVTHAERTPTFPGRQDRGTTTSNAAQPGRNRGSETGAAATGTTRTGGTSTTLNGSAATGQTNSGNSAATDRNNSA